MAPEQRGGLRLPQFLSRLRRNSHEPSSDSVLERELSQRFAERAFALLDKASGDFVGRHPIGSSDKPIGVIDGVSYFLYEEIKGTKNDTDLKYFTGRKLLETQIEGGSRKIAYTIGYDAIITNNGTGATPQDYDNLGAIFAELERQKGLIN